MGGQHDHKCAAAAHYTLDLDLATVRLDDLFGDRQSKTYAAKEVTGCFLDADERLVHVMHPLHGKADSLVGYLDTQPVVLNAHTHVDITAFRAELDCIVQQSTDRTAQTAGVARYLGKPIVDLYVYCVAGAGCLLLYVFDGFVDDLIDAPIQQWMHRIQLNTTYWENWPTEENPYVNGAFWHLTFPLMLHNMTAK